MEKILSYIEDTYAPAALFVYGSYADGSAGPDSDFDALALVADGPARRDVSRVGGVQLDLFVHPAADFQGDFPMAEFLRLLDGKLVWDLDGSGKALLEKLAAYRDGLPAKTPEENRTQVAWCRKMLQRAGRGDAEGLFRWHWLLVDSLEICCDLCGRLYQGPKKSLRWLAAARPEAYALYTDALSRLDAAALERWVAYLEALLDGPQ